MSREHNERWLYCLECKKNYIGKSKHYKTICPDCMGNLWEKIHEMKK